MTAGRDEIEIDFKKVDNLLKMGCSGTEIAASIGCHPDTLYKRVEKIFNTNFSAYAQEKRAIGDSILRAKQFEVAIGNEEKDLKPNVTMLIWLGKQRLGQSEKVENTEEKQDKVIVVLPSEYKTATQWQKTNQE